KSYGSLRGRSHKGRRYRLPGKAAEPHLAGEIALQCARYLSRISASGDAARRGGEACYPGRHRARRRRQDESRAATRHWQDNALSQAATIRRVHAATLAQTEPAVTGLNQKLLLRRRRKRLDSKSVG